MNRMIPAVLSIWAGLGMYTQPFARAGDWSVDVTIVAGHPGRIWVEPVYEIRQEQVWVEPVYEIRYERVWQEPVIEERCERVWIPDRYEQREIRCVDYTGRVVIRYETVLVEPGHYEERTIRVVIREGGWQTVERRVLVREGYWQYVPRQVCVREGYWTTAPWPRQELDIRVDRGRVYSQPVRRDDADYFRSERERNRNQQKDRESAEHVRDRRDRGERYR